MNEAFVTGIGVFLPNAPVGNDQIEQVLGVVNGLPSRLKKRVLKQNGIITRYYAIDPATGEETHSNAQLTARAVEAMAAGAGMSLDEIDCLACGTSSADQLIPSHGCMVHAELGCAPCEVASMSGVCCSGMSAFKYGYLHVASGSGPNAVVAGSEYSSVTLKASHFEPEVRLLRELDQNPMLAFENDFLRWMLSDGAGAILITPQPGQHGISLHIDWIHLLSYANESDACMYAGMRKNEDGTITGYRSVSDPAEFCRGRFLSLAQDIRILRDRLPVLMKQAFLRVREQESLQPDRIDWLLVHYSSEWFRPLVVEGLKASGFEIGEEKWFSNLHSKGNVGSASIYLMLEELASSGRMRSGDRILCMVPESARMTFAFLHLTVV